MIKNLLMSVNGMKDVKCEHKVLSALGEIEGVRAATVDVPGGLVAVSMEDSNVCENKIRHAISKQGYTVT